MKRGRWLWLCALALIAPFCPQLPGCMMSTAPRTGTVVDAQTGGGLAEVLVFASARFSQGALVHGSTSEAVYGATTRTDSSGHYTFPAFWTKFRIGIPGNDARMRWTVTAFRPGFAVVGDEKGWLINARGESDYNPNSVENTPNATFIDAAVHVAPIRMQAQQFSLREAAVYYRKLLGVGMLRYDSDAADDVEARKVGYDVLTPWVCSEAEDSSLELPIAFAILAFALKPRQAADFFIAQNNIKLGVSANRTIYIPATRICEAMRIGGGP